MAGVAATQTIGPGPQGQGPPGFPPAKEGFVLHEQGADPTPAAVRGLNRRRGRHRDHGSPRTTTPSRLVSHPDLQLAVDFQGDQGPPGGRPLDEASGPVDGIDETAAPDRAVCSPASPSSPITPSSGLSSLMAARMASSTSAFGVRDRCAVGLELHGQRPFERPHGDACCVVSELVRETDRPGSASRRLLR